MKEFLHNWITVAVTAVIILTIFESLLPNENIKKTGMFVGKIIFLISILIPVVSLVNNSWSMDLWQSYYDHSFEMNKELYEFTEDDIETQRRLIEDLYYQNTVDRIENYISGLSGIYSASADVIIEKSNDRGQYGSIKRIYAYVTYDKTKSIKPEAKEIEKKVAEYFGVLQEYIYVEIM